MRERETTLRGRQVHLDFHTGPWIPGVGAAFDAREFARTMREAHVDSVTVFAKCHHGHLYYDTARPERHPGLKAGLDLLGEQIEALHREGIRAPVYVSVQCDEYAANVHPEWVARRVDGTVVAPKPLTRDPYAWQILDMSSPYQEYLAEQVDEVLRKFRPVDGMFFDMCWDQFSVSKWAVAAMRKWGGNPERLEDRVEHAHRTAVAYMRRFYRMVKGASRDATVYFNSRPLQHLPRDVEFLTQVEIEALPSGGWGYLYFPKNVRFARTLGRPYLGMTARFHKGWADFGGLKPRAALEYETSQMMAHAAGCSIGDQMHPGGRLDRAAYKLIGGVYARVREREEWLTGARSVAEVAVLRVPVSPEAGVGTTMAGAIASGPEEGVVRMLVQLKQQFDFIGPDADWGTYALVVLPDVIPVDASLARKLDAYVRGGGAVLATGMSGLSSDGTRATWRGLPVNPAGLSPFTTTYFRMERGWGGGMAETDHVMYERGVRVAPGRGARCVARVVEPYFERSWEHFSSHAQTPGAALSDWSAAVVKGGVGYVAYPVFGAYAIHGNVPFRELIGSVLGALLPEPLVRVEGPSSMEVTATRQGTGRGERTIVHLLQYSPERRTPQLDIVEDVIPVRNVMLSVRRERRPGKVYTAPDRTPLKFRYAMGRASVTVPEINGHAMVAFE